MLFDRHIRIEFVAIAITPHQHSAMPVSDALNDALEGLNVETSAGPNGNAAHINACLLAAGNSRSNQITSSEALNGLKAGEVTARKTIGCDAGPLVAAASRRLDDQRGEAPAYDTFGFSNAQGIESVGLWDAEAYAVPLGPASAGGCHGHARGLQCLEQPPAGGVDRRCVLQGSLGLGQDLLQPLGIVRQELPNVPAALRGVASLTGQGEVRHPVGPTFGPAVYVLDLERDVLGIAVGALPMPLLQQILPDFVALECALLVLDATDLRVLHGLGIEADEFLGQNRNGSHSLKVPDPGHCSVHPMLEAGGQPSLSAGPIAEPGRTIAQVARPPATAVARALLERLGNAASTVLEFAKPQSLADLPGDLGDRNPGELRAGIEGEADRLDRALLALLEADHEGEQLGHHGPAVLQQDARTGGSAGHQRPSLLGQYKNTGVTTCTLDLGLRLGP